MQVSVVSNNQIKPLANNSFGDLSPDVKHQIAQITPIAPRQNILPAEDKSRIEPKGVVANAGYAWVNTAEMVKGFVKGLIYGALAGGIYTVGSTVYSGIKNKNNIKGIIDRFRPKKAMSKTNKFIAWALAGTVFAGNIVLAKLRANQRSANVDHMLKDGHRS